MPIFAGFFIIKKDLEKIQDPEIRKNITYGKKIYDHDRLFHNNNADVPHP